LTVKMFPVSAFSGFGLGLIGRLSRHVPVHSGLGSIFAPAWVYL
jgi:hypothetical protein